MISSKAYGNKITWKESAVLTIKMEIILSEIIPKEKEKVLEPISLLLEIKLRENGMVMITVQENYFTLMVKFMREKFTKEKGMDGENTFIKVARFMKDNGEMIKSLATDNTLHKIEGILEESGAIIIKVLANIKSTIKYLVYRSQISNSPLKFNLKNDYLQRLKVCIILQVLDLPKIRKDTLDEKT